ncbi:MAG: pilus assembly protein N-terminal domain-containing protein [Acidobacteria bacterium]|nr:pilus assembly protein N-terminal domain-containing protein [Acidobacteriota bacterium]MBI3423681.1 pilus assembly protein N-terminal domain-containing protein [Acidobacteriota bacterium]
MMTTFPSNTRKFCRSALSVSLLFLVLLASSVPTRAQAFAQENSLNVSFSAPPKEAVPVYVLAGQSVLIVFDQSIGRLAVSNSDVAEAVLVAPNQMMINGKVSGRATFTAWSKDTSTFVFFSVDVRVNLAQLDSQVRVLFPNMDIRLSQANGAVVISGSIPPAMMKQVETVVNAAGYKTVNLIGQSVEHIAQVQLSVKVAEVTRNKLSEFSYAPVYQPNVGQGGYTNTGAAPWSLSNVTNGNMFGTVASSLNVFFMSNNVFNFIRALQNNGALRALAEPNLVAMDGQEASFLAGGEIPVPVVLGTGGATVLWKEYGIRLRFKPTILDEQHIRLDIEPEVSSLDFANAVRFEGFLIPALRTRKAKTGIELQNGQTFGIAGLMDNNETKSLGKIPVLADVPILGQLFKSRSFQRNESELVFIVTTKIVKPWNPDEVPQLKGVDNLQNGSPLGITLPSGSMPKDDKTGANSEASKEAGKDSPAEQPKDKEKPGEVKEEGAAPAATPVAPVEGVKPTVIEAVPAPAPAANPAATTPEGEKPGEKPAPPGTPAATPEASGGTTVPADSSAPSNTSPQTPTSKETPTNPDKEKPPAPVTKPGAERVAKTGQALQAMQWKLMVPATPAAAVTAQTRP